MTAHVSSPTMVGRDNELQRLEAAWRVTVDGESQLILVSGDAGIGKTRLASEFAERVKAGGGRVLSGACIDLREGGLPYAPIRQALRNINRSQQDRQLIESLRDGLAAVLPDLSTPEDEFAAWGEQDRRVRLFESIFKLFQELAATTPVLLFVDDVQWADQGTLDLLTFLARNLVGVRVLELLTFRNDRLAPDDPLQGFLLGQGSGTVRDRLRLRPLDEGNVAEQIAGIVESSPDPQLVTTVFERSDGNPFFVEELLAAEADNHRMPSTVRDLLLSRILHLPDATRQVMRLAAVAGHVIAHDTLAQVANIGDRDLSTALHAAVDARVLEPEDDSYAFRHTLLREALYDDLLPRERRRIHRAYASALAAGHQPGPSMMGAVATHHDLGGEPERALPAFVEAADAAEHSFAFSDAERYLCRAVELWDMVGDPSVVLTIDKATLLTRALEAALAIEDTERAIRYGRAALRLVDARREPARAGLLHSLLGRALWMDDLEQEAHDAYVTALRTVPEHPPSRERAEILAQQAAQLALEGRFVAARALGAETVQVAQSAHTVINECRALLATGSVTARLGSLMPGLRMINEGESLARAHGFAVELMRVYLHRGRALQRYAAWEAAWRNYIQGTAEAPKFGMTQPYGWRFQALAARMLFYLGRWADARDLLRQARDLRTGGAATLVPLLIASGQWDAATRWFAQRHPRWQSDGTGLLQQPEAAVELATWLGNYDDALDHCAEGLALLSHSEDPLPLARLGVAGLRAHADRAEAAGSTPPRSAHAEHLHDRLLGLTPGDMSRSDAWGRELAALTATGTAELSRLGDGDSALWRRASRAWSDLSMPYPAAYARFRQGQQLLTTSGDRNEAAALLRDASGVARELGAQPLIRLIGDNAARAGLTLDDPRDALEEDPADMYDLTPRERQVLDLLVKGYSNRAIGEGLYIAERTASVHVSRILRKMGVSSRGEAIGRVLRDRSR